MLFRLGICLCLLINAVYQMAAQSETYYIFSNLAGENDEIINLYQQDVNKKDDKSTILSLGDSDISILKALKKASPDSKVKFLTGDKDQSKLKHFQKLDATKGYKYLTKGNYCPDPKIKELDDDNVMISINSNWFLDRDIEFAAKDEDCKTFNQADLFDELESIIEDYEGKNIIILAHHTPISNTNLNGNNLWPYDLIPLAGNLYASYRRHIGRQQDLTSRRYKHYAKKMITLGKYPNVNIITGHDYTTSIYEKSSARCINVNSGNKSFSIKKNVEGAIYQNTKPSYLKLTIDKQNTKIEIVNQLGRNIIPLTPKAINYEVPEHNNQLTKTGETSVAASQKYGSNRLKNWFMGSGYRKAWSTPVNASVLDLDQSGLKPYARGGGLQTQSIKLKNQENQKFAFRALDKEPEKSLNDVLQKSAYKKVVQELIATMHPYGPLVADQLIKETDIIHIPPRLYIMAAGQDEMNSYSDFDNKIGTLEEKPKGKSKNRKGYQGADKVVTSHQMLADLMKDSDHRLDKRAYARARVFDMYIGDWDRHEDNWKWAMYKDGKSKSYLPIPKDRDHVFSKWTGLLPKTADFFIANAENFGEKFGNLRQLNFKAYYLDRQLATELSAEDWQAAVEYINSKMTDDVIENSINAFPIEVKDLYSDEIVHKLKSRRSDLSRAVYSHYCNISTEVNVVGTNKRDYFEIIRMDQGKVKVIIYKSNKKGDKTKKYYERIFTPDVTNTIYCYGLDGVDIFEVRGEVDKSLKIRIIGGDDEDKITDRSSVGGRSKSTQVYDSSEEDIISDIKNEINIKKPSRNAYYEPYASSQNSILPLPSIRKSSGNGWGVDFGIQYIAQGYNKPDYAKYFKANILYYPQIGAYRIDGSYKFRHIIGKSDFITKLRISDEYDKFPYLYGIGSETTFDDEAREDGLYRLDYDYTRYDVGLSKTFFEKSQLENTIFVEYHGIDAEENSGILESSLPSNTFFYGYQSHVSLDFTDETKYPTDGNKFNTKVEARLSSNNRWTANLQSDISYYKSANIGVLTTLAAKVGYQSSWGDSNFYHLSSLGSNVGLSGYTRNRFLDQHAAFYNTELRFDLGTIHTPIIQMQVGTFLLHDAGKVWNDNSSFGNNDWKSSYGIGIFIAPYSTEYALSFSLIRSEDYNYYQQFQLGFSF